MLRILALMLLTFTANTVMADMHDNNVVNCDRGQSLNRALSTLDKHTPATVFVKGTCTEYVLISGFEDLTVKGLPGATLALPTTSSHTNLFVTLLRIDASRSVVIDGLSILSTASGLAPVGIGHGSVDVRLRNLMIEGGNPGINVFEHSQVSIAHVTVKNPGYAAVGIYDLSDVHIELCLFEDLTGTGWHVGVGLGASHVTMYGTTIRNMQVGLSAAQMSIIDVNYFNTYFPPSGVTDVILDNPAGNNFNGVVIDSGSSLNLNSAKLRIANAGQTWGGNSGGVLIEGGSTMSMYSPLGGGLVVSGSHGQGVFVTDNSHATLDGSSITGGLHGGLLAVNLSTISTLGDSPTTVGGNATDLFCDSQSMITGGANISNATTVQCANVLPGDNVPVP